MDGGIIREGIVFVGRVTRLSNFGTHYGKLRVDASDGKSFVVCVGDTINLKAPAGQLPYIAKVKDMWSDKYDERWVRCYWYFRQSDIRGPSRDFMPRDAAENEIFLSSVMETNRVQCITSHCPVVHISGAAGPKALLCRFMYNPKSSKTPFRPLNAEDLPPVNIQLYKGRKKPENKDKSSLPIASLSASLIGPNHQAEIPDATTQNYRRTIPATTIFCAGKVENAQLDAYLAKAKASKKFQNGDDVWIRSDHTSCKNIQLARIIEVNTNDTMKVAPFYSGLVGEAFTIKISDIVDTSFVHLLEHLDACSYDVEAALHSIPERASSWSCEEKMVIDGFLSTRKKGSETVEQLRSKLPLKERNEIIDYYYAKYVVDSDNEDDSDMGKSRKRLAKENLDSGEPPLKRKKKKSKENRKGSDRNIKKIDTVNETLRAEECIKKMDWNDFVYRVRAVLDDHECERFFDIVCAFCLEEIRRSTMLSNISKLLEGYPELLHLLACTELFITSSENEASEIACLNK